MGGRINADAVKKVKGKLSVFLPVFFILPGIFTGYILGVFRFDITENKKVVKTWTADLKNGDGSLVEGEGTKPDVTIIVADADFVQLAAGKLDAQKGWLLEHLMMTRLLNFYFLAFFSGKLKVKGNIMLSQKLGAILKQ